MCGLFRFVAAKASQIQKKMYANRQTLEAGDLLNTASSLNVCKYTSRSCLLDKVNFICSKKLHGFFAFQLVVRSRAVLKVAFVMIHKKDNEARNETS